jgi:arylsulfatase A-like enzyme
MNRTIACAFLSITILFLNCFKSKQEFKKDEFIPLKSYSPISLFYPRKDLEWSLSVPTITRKLSSHTTKDVWAQAEFPLYAIGSRSEGIDTLEKFLLLQPGQTLTFLFDSKIYKELLAEENLPEGLELKCDGNSLPIQGNPIKLICGFDVEISELQFKNFSDELLFIPSIILFPIENSKIDIDSNKIDTDSNQSKNFINSINESINLGSRNILFIVVDSLRADAVGRKGVTPNLDGLANESISFNNHLVNAAWTRPSTTVFFTGQYASKSGVNFWDYPVPREEANSFYSTGKFSLPLAFAKNGFHSEMIGNNPFVTDRYGIGVDFGFLKIQEFSRIPQDTRLITNSALNYIQKISQSHNSRFLFLNYNDPHKPYTPENIYKEKVLKENPGPYDDERLLDYLGEVAFVDEQLGKLFSEMKRLNLWDQSMIIITSDHGEVMNAKHAISLFTGTNTLFGHGQGLYKEDIHVPLLIKPFKNSNMQKFAGKKINQLTRSIDILPTILEESKISINYPLDGKSLHPILRKEEKFTREYYGETRGTQAIQQGDIKLIRKSFLFHRLGFWKGFVGTEKDYLFDLAKDPNEENPILMNHAIPPKEKSESTNMNSIYSKYSKLKDRLDQQSKSNAYYTIRIVNPRNDSENTKTKSISTEISSLTLNQSKSFERKVKIRVILDAGQVRPVYSMPSEIPSSRNEFTIFSKLGDVKEFHFQVYPDVSLPKFQIMIDDTVALPSQWGVGSFDLYPKNCLSKDCSDLLNAKSGPPNLPKDFRIQIWRTGNTILHSSEKANLGSEAMDILKKQGYVQ